MAPLRPMFPSNLFRKFKSRLLVSKLNTVAPLVGVVNVIMRKGSNSYHGSLFATYESDAMDGPPNSTVGAGLGLRYDPSPTTALPADADAQTYVNRKDHFRIVQPGFTIGGPVVKDRLWFFLGFAPEYHSLARTVDFTPSAISDNSSLGKQVLGP